MNGMHQGCRSGNRFNAIHPQWCAGTRQRGVALAVALILLVVITLIGLAAVSGTIMQSRMAANQYDRETAFQSAESALRTAEQRLQNNDYSTVSTRTCGPTSGDSPCLANPFVDPNLPAGSIYPVSAGTALGQYTAPTLATGQPEYVIENMGGWIDPTTNLGGPHDASCGSYGAKPGCSFGTTYTYYRITARSGDPATAGDRAIVTLQAVVK